MIKILKKRLFLLCVAQNISLLFKTGKDYSPIKVQFGGYCLNFL